MWIKRSKITLLALAFGAITLATTITCTPDLSALDGTTIFIDRDRHDWDWDDDDDWGFDFDWWHHDDDCCDWW